MKLAIYSVRARLWASISYDFMGSDDDREDSPLQDGRRLNRHRFREHSAHDSGRGNGRFKEGGSYRDRRHRDDRDREYNHGGHANRDYRNKEDVDRGRRGDWERRHGHERDREWRSRHRSRSQSRERKSRDQHSKARESKRTSGFDLAPAGATVMLGGGLSGSTLNPQIGMLPSTIVGAGNVVPNLGQLSGIGQPMHGVYPSMFPFAGGTQATRHARRVYVGGLPLSANEQSVATFFSQVMAAIGGNTAGPGDAVVNVYINQEKRFAFVEMRTVEEASNAMSLDGLIYEGVSVRVRRPSDYNPSMAATLGPSQPSAHLNLGAVGLIPGSTGIADGPDRIFVGGLPYHLTEEQIIDLLSSFGPLRAFELVKDRETGSSKGYGFCVYQDANTMDTACAALNGLKMGDRTLTVRRASASRLPTLGEANTLMQVQQQLASQKLAAQVNDTSASFGSMGNSVLMAVSGELNLGEAPSRVLCLFQVVSPEELMDDTEYEEILEDMRDECMKFGTIANLVIPRPGSSGDTSPGVGMVFVEYADTEGSLKAKTALNGRKFGGNTVIAVYYPEEKFLNGDFSG